jgi:acetyl esterase/lipase
MTAQTQASQPRRARRWPRARAGAKALLLETPRIWQSTYAATPPRSGHDDEPIQRAQKLLYARYREPIDLDDVAAKVGMSPRNFARRFRVATGEAPLAYIHGLRIDAARHALENAHRSVEEISREVGYEDVAFFRHLFRRHPGVAARVPGQVRRATRRLSGNPRSRGVSVPRMRLSRRRVLGFAAAVLAAALLWLWPARRNYYLKRDAVTYRLDVPYTSDLADPKRRLDLYLPRGAPSAPAVVFVHGGYWSALDRRMLQPLLGTYGNVGVALARHGVAAAVIGYRQVPRIQHGDDSLDDIAAAVRFVRESCPSWGCDPNRVFLVGHSAGGHLASLTALDERILRRNGLPPEALAGYASIDGVFDLGASLPLLKPDEASVLRQLFGPDDAALAAHSPMTYARPLHPPLLFVDSTGDEKLCLDSFRAMRWRMRQAGSPATFIELPGLGHNEAVIRVGTDDDPVLPLLLSFVR